MVESTLELLKRNKCFCLKRNTVIDLLDCDIDCYREKGCRKSTNNKVNKELKVR